MKLQPDNKTVVCNLCNHHLIYSHRSTTNLVRHVRVKHGIQYDAEIQRSKQPTQPKGADERQAIATETKPSGTATLQQTMAQVIDRTQKYKPDSVKKRLLDDHVLDLVTLDLQPLSVVENKGFRKLLNVLDPKYDIVSRTQLAKSYCPRGTMGKRGD